MDINFKNGSNIAVSEDLGKVVSKSVFFDIPSQQDINEMMEFFGMDADKMVKCPECNMKCQLKFMITHLNDRGETYSASYSTGWGKGNIKGFLKQEDVKRFENHEWSFKQIGKWLESLGY